MFDENLSKIAHTLVDCCKNGREADALSNLYADDAVSVEAVDMGDGAAVKGLDGIRGKHEWWNNSFEVHSSSVDGPYLHGDNRFSVIFAVDSTNKETGERAKMQEVAVYSVADGKIVREEFYYNAGE